MPTLIVAAYYYDESKMKALGKFTDPCVWYCSDCKQLFSLDKWVPDATATQLHRVDARFRDHCKRSHPDSPIVGLTIANPKEDANQAAARIVRESTEKA